MTQQRDAGADDRLLERLRAERDERRRLAELVHDGPVQHLAAVGQMLDAALLAFEQRDEPGARDLVTRAREVTREAAVDLRDLIAGVEPEALHETGLAAALEELAERVGSRRGVAFALDLPAAGLLGEGARSGLYQIVREAVDQAVRRGPPRRVTVAVAQTPTGGVRLELTDDGPEERRHAVVEALTERAADLNGTLEYARDAQLTTIAVTLPPSAAYA